MYLSQVCEVYRLINWFFSLTATTIKESQGPGEHFLRTGTSKIIGSSGSQLWVYVLKPCIINVVVLVVAVVNANT